MIENCTTVHTPVERFQFEHFIINAIALIVKVKDCTSSDLYCDVSLFDV